MIIAILPVNGRAKAHASPVKSDSGFGLFPADGLMHINSPCPALWEHIGVMDIVPDPDWQYLTERMKALNAAVPRGKVEHFHPGGQRTSA